MSIEAPRSRSTGSLQNTGNLNRTPTPTAPPHAGSNASPSRTGNLDQSQVDSRKATQSGLQGMIGTIAGEMAQSSNETVKATGEVLQLVLGSKQQFANVGELKKLLETKGVDPLKVQELSKAGVIARAFNVAQGAISAVKFSDLALEAAKDPSNLKDTKFLSGLMAEFGKTTQGVLSALELINKTPFAAKIPGIAGLIGGIAGIVKDIGDMKDGASASEIVSLIGNATGTLSNAMVVMAPATGGTSLAVAAGLKGISLAMDGVGFVLGNSEKIQGWGKKAWDWISGKG